MNNTIDRILCCHVLEHIDDYHKGIEELFRILKPGGWGIIAVPQTLELAKTKRTGVSPFQGYGHIWEFGNDFATQLRVKGFLVNSINFKIEKKTKTPSFIPYHIVTKAPPSILFLK